MSSTPQGPGWWQASDGRWYPPQQTPAQPAQPVPPSPTPPAPAQPPGPTGGAPGGFDPNRTIIGPLDKPTDVLIIRTGGTPHAFVPGATPTIGRDPTCDVTVDNARVSRHHARATFDGHHWFIEDTNSSTGVWVNGRRQPRVQLGGEMRVWLGPVGEGGELEITAPGTSPEVASASSRTLLTVIGIIAVLALLGGGIAFALSRRGSEVAVTTATTTKIVPLDDLIRATVYVDVGGGHGSGSILTPDGLILTNAHVAAPDALGQSVEQSIPGSQLPKPPKTISILMTKGEGQAAEKAYEAELLAADGYLDLAVLQITKDADGNDVDRSTLKLPYIEMGDSKTVPQGSEMRFIGYPGISDTKSATVTTGEVAGFVEDKRLEDNRAWINTSANIAGGNSGGAAVDVQGRLIGVPTISRFNKERAEQISRARSSHLAQPVIDAAKEKRDNPDADTYVTPYAPKGSGKERIAGDITTTDPAVKKEDAFQVKKSCPSGGGSDSGSSNKVLAVAIPYEGFSKESEDVLVAAVDEDGKAIAIASNADTFTTPLNGSGCFIVTMPLSAQPNGRVRILVFAGGDYKQVSSS